MAALMAELKAGAGHAPAYDRALASLHDQLGQPDALVAGARTFVERLGLLLQARLLQEHAPAAVAGLFVESRLAGRWSGAFGTLPPDPARLRPVLERALPVG